MAAGTLTMNCFRANLGRHRLWLGLASLAIAHSRAVCGATAAETTITKIDQVRALTRDEAAQGRAVSLKGIVIGEADSHNQAFVVLDESGSLYLHGPPNEVSALARGDIVEIKGVTDPGDFAPIVVARSVVLRGRTAVPAPRYVEVEDLYGGSLDAQWIEVKARYPQRGGRH